MGEGTRIVHGDFNQPFAEKEGPRFRFTKLFADGSVFRSRFQNLLTLGRSLQEQNSLISRNATLHILPLVSTRGIFVALFRFTTLRPSISCKLFRSREVHEHDT